MLSRGRIIGLLLTVAFLALALRSVNPAELGQALRQVNYIWLVPSALCTLAGYLLRTARWRVLLSRSARTPFGTLFSVLMMGFATNNLVPGRPGELWRAYLLGRKRGVRKTSALASVVVERVFDGLVLVAALLAVVLVFPVPDWGRRVGLIAGAIFLGATAVVTLAVVSPRTTQRLIDATSRWLPGRFQDRAAGMVHGFLDGLLVLRKPSVLLEASLLSVGVWIMEGLSYLLLAQGVKLGLSPAVQVPAIGLTLVTINLGIMVPSGPGYVGTQEAFGSLALGAFGVAAATALALVALSHAVQYVLVTALGLVFFAREDLSPLDLRRARAAEAEIALE